jgi:hypothetical protein
MYDEDAQWEGYDEEVVEEEEIVEEEVYVPVVPPPSPTPAPTMEVTLSEQPQSHKQLSMDLRKKWQIVQLTVQFAAFRTSRRWKRRLSF